MELLTKLGEIQKEYGYLPSNEIEKLSKESGVSASEILGTASFYEYLKFDQKDEQDHIEDLYPLRKEGILLGYKSENYAALKKVLEDPENIINEIDKAGLKGRSGSAFPTATKWKLTADTEADQKYIVCNADEGEPGTGKDRILLQRNPKAVVEGMAIAAIAAGASKGYIYLRQEYEDIKDVIKSAIDELPECGFEVEIYMGHGAYVCGEETALLNSIEGKRGEPRLKPPFPGTCGLFGKPTIINNAETFGCVPMIIKDGADSFAKYGTKDYSGPKLFTIFGDVQNPGVYELEAGITLSDCINEAGGPTAPIKAILTGGGSGTLLTKDYLDMKLSPALCRERGASFGVASIRVLSENADIVSEVRKLNDFYIRESCGTCTPCREGLQRVGDILRNIEKGNHSQAQNVCLRALLDYIPTNARCGLGQAAITPVKTLLDNFQEELV